VGQTLWVDPFQPQRHRIASPSSGGDGATTPAASTGEAHLPSPPLPPLSPFAFFSLRRRLGESRRPSPATTAYQFTGHASTASGRGKGCHGSVKVSFGYNLVRGMTNHPMEDYHVVDLRDDLGLFAIFDGHLGDTVPAFLQKNLFPNILKEEEFWTHTDRALTKAYEKTDQAILSHTPDLGQGGSTAVTAILVNGRKLWVANVGDSRAVLLKGDHDPNVERSVIENRGGFVSNMPGDVPRVCGQLAVSRAFGDRNLKSLLRSEPDIKVEDIDHTAELLVLASDGLWKVMNNQEAVDLAKRYKDPYVAAKQLTTEALKRESKDDISCIVVRFKA
ncbi:hypothetical protein U9M48_033942, partial [Paspalum notatum var. saurae]